MPFIPYGRQEITEQDVDAVVDVLRSDWLTQGPCVPQFEDCVAKYCGANHAVAVNSATSALHIACLALGLGPGDELWTSAITFVASANCGRFCGATVDFVDIDPGTYNLCARALRTKLIAARRSRRLPKVVVPVHFGGQPCDMAEIYQLSREFGFRIIEDASHAIGAIYDEGPIGNCRFSDVTIFSFHPVKIVTTAEGGMALTNDADLAEKMTLLRSHGITRDPSKMTGGSEGSWYYQQIELGFNYRMTELQAALGLSQVQRLDDYVLRRHELASRYDRLLDGLPLAVQQRVSGTYSAIHLYVVRLRLDQISRSHREVFESLRAQGIGVNVHYIPVYLQPYYARLGFGRGYCPEAEHYYAEAISLPMFPAMSETQQDQVVVALSRSM